MECPYPKDKCILTYDCEECIQKHKEEEIRADERAKTIDEFYKKLIDNFDKNLRSAQRNKLPNIYANLDRIEINKIYEQMKGGQNEGLQGKGN